MDAEAVVSKSPHPRCDRCGRCRQDVRVWCAFGGQFMPTPSVCQRCYLAIVDWLLERAEAVGSVGDEAVRALRDVPAADVAASQTGGPL
jgi:hypothetical protein